MNQEENVLSNIYHNASNPAAYQDADKIHLTLKDGGNNDIGIHKIRKWLHNQDDYSLHNIV